VQYPRLLSGQLGVEAAAAELIQHNRPSAFCDMSGERGSNESVVFHITCFFGTCHVNRLLMRPAVGACVFAKRTVCTCASNTCSIFVERQAAAQLSRPVQSGLLQFVEGSMETPLLALTGIELPHKGRRPVQSGLCSQASAVRPLQSGLCSQARCSQACAVRHAAVNIASPACTDRTNKLS
jgi:hypothetical protein